MPTRYGQTPWLHRFPASRAPSHRVYRGHGSSQVAIVGGGLTGCATAYAFAAAGVAAVLVEADRVGLGSSGSSSGWIADDPGARFVDVEKTLGLRAARYAWQAWRRSALDLAALIRRLGIRCGLEPVSTTTVARTDVEAARLAREQKARRRAGLEATALRSRAVMAEAAIDAEAGLRTRGGFAVDPYRLTVGLAKAAADRGAQLFERSAVRRIVFKPKYVDVITGGGTIRADRVVVATGAPTALFRSLMRHFWQKTSFLALTDTIPAGVRRELGPRTSAVRDSAEPPHFIRWADDRMLVAGADAPDLPPRLRAKTLVQRTGQLMYELSAIYPAISGIPPAYGWDAPYARTADGLPYVGPHRNYPRHLFAFGDSSHSITGAFLASRILLRHYLDRLEPPDEVFGFTR